ncbi:MAG: Wzz/FepE/Etk N-terminal domain-containing protein [Anaerolineae bacterium]
MEFRQYWNIARQRGWIVILVAVVAAVAALGVSLIMPKVYEASIQLSVEPARPDWGLNQATKDLMRNYAFNIQSHTMTQEAIDRAQLDMTTDQFLANLDVSSDSSNLTLTILTESRSEGEAILMAQTLADVFVEDRDQWNQQIDQRDRIYIEKVDDVRDAVLASPKWKINMLAGAVFGAIAGGIVVFFLEWLQSDILRSASDVTKAIDMPVLGAIPTAVESGSARRRRWGLPGWIEPGLVLTFGLGLALGAAVGALVVSLL